jgi:SAM-dependent methyltransferase
MRESVRQFYDDLSSHYHRMFEDWEASTARQSAALAPLLERECGPGPLRILDCACGIGTQSLGLAARGFRVTGCDISSRAILRARGEAKRRGLEINLCSLDMLHLEQLEESGFDAVICMDNALPHLDDERELLAAVSQIRNKLRAGGMLFISIRDYDLLLQERPAVQGPAFFSDSGRRRIVFQLWDWTDDRRYVFHLYITRRTGDGWKTFHRAARYRAVLRSELAEVLEKAGFREVRWLFPADTGFYQPIAAARA